MSRLVRINNTQSRISFFTFREPPFDRIDAFDEFATPDATGTLQPRSSLVQWQYTKQLGQASGRATITLKGHKVGGHPQLAGKPWPELVEEGDWWMIDVIKNGVKQGLSFGRVDDVAVNIAANQGEGNITVTITGRDIGFALEDTPVYFNEYDQTQDNAVGKDMQRIIQTAAGDPATVVTNIIKGFMGVDSLVEVLGGSTRVPPRLGGSDGSPVPTDPRGEFWGNFIDFSSCVQGTLKGRIATPTLFGQREDNSVWNLVQAWRNPVMNELYLDIVPLFGVPKQACLVFREKPFVNRAEGADSAWFDLRSWEVDASMLRALQLQRGQNRINHVQLLGDMVAGLSQDSYAIHKPFADFEDVSRHGLRRLQEHTRYYDTVKDQGAQVELQNLWQPLLIDWNALNHHYWQGRMDLAEMRAEVRVGQKIFLINGPPIGYSVFPNDRAARLVPGNEKAANQMSLSFYVEGMQHTFVAGESPTATTSFMVSRGYVEGERVRDVTERADRFTTIRAPGANTQPRNLDPTTPLVAKEIDAVKAAVDYVVKSTEGIL